MMLGHLSMYCFCAILFICYIVFHNPPKGNPTYCVTEIGSFQRSVEFRIHINQFFHLLDLFFKSHYTSIEVLTYLNFSNVSRDYRFTQNKRWEQCYKAEPNHFQTIDGLYTTKNA